MHGSLPRTAAIVLAVVSAVALGGCTSKPQDPMAVLQNPRSVAEQHIGATHTQQFIIALVARQ